MHGERVHCRYIRSDGIFGSACNFIDSAGKLRRWKCFTPVSSPLLTTEIGEAAHTGQSGLGVGEESTVQVGVRTLRGGCHVGIEMRTWQAHVLKIQSRSVFTLLGYENFYMYKLTVEGDLQQHL